MRRDCRVAPSWQEPEKREAIEVQLRLITPMFGGGYKSREVDPLMPIRPAAIRGHLRFWWRATAGAQYASAAELYKAETAIWGGANEKGEPVMGKVEIQVEIVERGELKKCAEYVWDEKRKRYKALPQFLHGWPSYALHPFQGKAEKDRVIDQPASALCGTRFLVRIFHDATVDEAELRTALFAWMLYGGVGSRTRRGCGSLVSVPLDTPIALHLKERNNKLLTVLKGSQYVLGELKNNPIEAWSEAVKLYQTFRQGRGYARAQHSRNDPSRPGQSFWPEADSIRRITKQWSSQHKPKNRPECGFPRADLGLPIVFHFKDVDAGDPDDTVVQLVSRTQTRFASPVITKAFPVGESKYRPLLMVLNAPHAWEGAPVALSWVGGSKIYEIGKRDIELVEPERKEIKPLSPPELPTTEHGKPVREALLLLAQKRWNSKIEVI